MKRHLFIATALSLLASLAVGCGSGDDIATTDSPPPQSPVESERPTTEVGADTVVFVWAETGGCAMGGPNCARYEVTAAGTVMTYRENQDETVATGSVDPALVTEWLTQLESTDIDALTDQLAPGELAAAFDGIDNTVSAPHRGIELSSVDYAFDPRLPFFDAAQALVSAAQEAAPLEITMRE